MYLRNPAEHKCSIAVADEGRLRPAMLPQDVPHRRGHVVRAQGLPGQADADVAPLQQNDWPGAEGGCELMDELEIWCLHHIMLWLMLDFRIKLQLISHTMMSDDRPTSQEPAACTPTLQRQSPQTLP